MPYARFGGCRHNILRDPEGGHKMAMTMELEIEVEVIRIMMRAGSRC